VTDQRGAICGAATLVVKVGSSSLTLPGGGIDVRRVDDLVDALSEVIAVGRRVVLVSSGAIATGFPAMGITHRPRTLAGKQAAASVGQGILLAHYASRFASHGLRVGQVLLTVNDLVRPTSYRNAWSTLDTLLGLGVVPIVNENDTVATGEIRFGDNDRLAALVAELVRAQALILLSASPPLHPSLHRTLNPHHVEENDMQFIQAAHHSADPNLPPTRVVIHATCPDVGFPSASRAGRAVGTAGYLASISASGSAHYVCDATETVQYLGEDVIGWLAPPNGHSIGIEICADGGSRASFNNPSHAYSPKQWLSPQVWLAVEKAAHLTRQICHRYAIPMRRLTVAGTPRRGCVRCRRRRSVSRVAGNRRCRWMFLTARRGGPARVQVRLRCPARSPERGPLLGWLPGGGAFVMPRHLPSPVGVIVPGTISSRSQQEIPSQRRTQLRSPDSPPDYPQNRPTPSPEGKKKTS
jgi:hypothetical protein